MNKPGRNEPCPCGSGKKYKRCCLSKSYIPAGKEHSILEQQMEAIKTEMDVG
ncbi:MAG: SEC-C domain-containing protein [Nitrospirae bacterium]|nr:SEC-C domain-containing protein [Nitrospirota bacterium]